MPSGGGVVIASRESGPSLPLVVAEGVTLGYGRSIVVHDVTLTVNPGEYWFLLGPNGAGKSTFARAVLGLLPTKAGRLDRGEGLDRGKSIGFVPQHCALHPTLSMTLREFVELGFGALRVPAAERATRVEWAVEVVGLAGRLGSDVHDLSGGMRQRAMVARALVRDPRLLVLDEPTSSLDPASQEALLVVLARLRRERGLALLFVCHDIAVAARYATHVALFHDGVVEAGGRELMFDEATLRRVFGLDICVSLDAVGHATFHIESSEAVA
jgi:ABC-type Mn2+/Zn2+ transport system ATPase subunit